MARIFISYSRADRYFIDSLIPLILRVYGNNSVWFDDNIHGGGHWWEMILSEINKCDIFIYLVSNESLESTYCQAELMEALRLNKQILPLVIRPLKPDYPGDIDPELAVILRKTQYIDLSRGFKNEVNNAKLWGAINQLLSLASEAPLIPITSIPTPEPLVIDKRRNKNIQISYIVITFLVLVIIVGAFMIWGSSIFKDNSSSELSSNVTINPSTIIQQVTPDNPPSEIAIEHQISITPTLVITPTPVDSASTNETQYPIVVEELEEDLSIPIIPEIHINPDPFSIAQTPVNRNTDWIPLENSFDEVTMVLVPVGCFMMGEDGAGGEQCFEDPFWIDKTEVTQADFIRLAGVKKEFNAFIGNERPVEQITWFEANNFCKLRNGRLPTEAEWEYVVRGVESWIYPWGNAWNGNLIIWRRDNERGTADVASRIDNASWVGALDMIGNVWEWTSSLYEDYPYNLLDGRERNTGDITNVHRVLRGGSRNNYNPDYLRSTVRSWFVPDYWSSNLGFRCVRDYDSH